MDATNGCPDFKYGLKDEQCCQTAAVCIKIVSRVRLAVFTSVRSIRSKETLRILYPKYPVLDMIQRIHSRFRIKNPDLNLNKETHPTIEPLTLITWSLRSGIFQKFSSHAKQVSRNLTDMASNSSSQSSQEKVGKFLQLSRFLYYNHVPRVCWMKSGT